MRDSDMHGSGEVADRGSFPGKTKSLHMHVQLKSSRPRSARAGIRATCVRQKPLIMGSLLACTPPRFAGWLAGWPGSLGRSAVQEGGTVPALWSCHQPPRAAPPAGTPTTTTPQLVALDPSDSNLKTGYLCI
jgi:hypothetical protein